MNKQVFFLVAVLKKHIQETAVLTDDQIDR